MSKVTTSIVMLLSMMLIAGAVGCVFLSEAVTPTDIDKPSVKYAEKYGVVEPNEFDGYPSLRKAKKLDRAVDGSHSLRQLTLKQKIEMDSAEYAIHKDATVQSVQNGETLRDSLFSEKGFVPLLISLLGGGTLAGYFGYKTKRSGDLTREEANEEVGEAVADSESRAASASSQLFELIGRVQKFLDANKDGVGAETQAAKELKAILGDKQSPELRTTVATVKANL